MGGAKGRACKPGPLFFPEHAPTGSGKKLPVSLFLFYFGAGLAFREVLTHNPMEQTKGTIVRTADALIVGAVYKVNHSRKGLFDFRVDKISGEWVDGRLVKGRAQHIRHDKTRPGERFSMRFTLATWTLESMPANV